MSEEEVDYKRKYLRLRKKYKRAKRERQEMIWALREWLKAQFYSLFMKDVKTYPHGREAYDKAIQGIMWKTSCGQRLINAIGDDWDEMLANGMTGYEYERKGLL